MKKRICVIGACNLDLVGRCDHDYRPGDASEGRYRLQSGGVGRNLAQGLHQAGHVVDFVSVLGEDVFGEILEKELQEQDFSFHKVSRPRSDLFLGLEKQDGELYGALADMQGIEDLGFSELPHELLDQADALVLDCCLSEELLGQLCTQYGAKPIYVDGVSIDRVGRICPFLEHVHLLKINRAEQMSLTALGYIDQAMEELLQQGLGGILLSLGEEGLLYKNKNMERRARKEAEVILSTLGAGDALFSTFIASELDEKPIDEIMEAALHRALSTLTTYDSWKGHS